MINGLTTGVAPEAALVYDDHNCQGRMELQFLDSFSIKQPQQIQPALSHNQILCSTFS